ncbi:MAG TPA: sigma-70 family RNA polymerase sigma factor [Jatrophihabitans sp.]|jgi:RNA polymerase sigma factor for flagellar operon FliA
MSNHAGLAEDVTSQATPSADELVEQNLPLVGHLVRETMTRLPAHVNRDDLISAGMTALVLSARSYEKGRGVPFARFAAIRIRGALLDELRNMDWASRSVRSRARELETVRSSLTAALGRSPRPQELAHALGVSAAELSSIDADVQRASVLSLQGFAPETGAAMMPDAQRGPEQLIVDREQIGFLNDAIEELPERLRYVVRCYFFEQRQMSDIAAELGVTESRISQLRAEALKLLRHGMKAQYGEQDTEDQSGRSGAKLASYAAAIASRSTLSNRLNMSTPMGEAVASAYAPDMVTYQPRRAASIA